MPKKILKGTVVSEKMNNTIVVSVETSKRHPIYKKLITTTKKFKARNNTNVKVGDVVSIVETKPFSKTVTWEVIEETK